MWWTGSCDCTGYFNRNGFTETPIFTPDKVLRQNETHVWIYTLYWHQNQWQLFWTTKAFQNSRPGWNGTSFLVTMSASKKCGFWPFTYETSVSDGWVCIAGRLLTTDTDLAVWQLRCGNWPPPPLLSKWWKTHMVICQRKCEEQHNSVHTSLVDCC